MLIDGHSMGIIDPIIVNESQRANGRRNGPNGEMSEPQSIHVRTRMIGVSRRLLTGGAPQSITRDGALSMERGKKPTRLANWQNITI